MYNWRVGLGPDGDRICGLLHGAVKLFIDRRENSQLKGLGKHRPVVTLRCCIASHQKCKWSAVHVLDLIEGANHQTKPRIDVTRPTSEAHSISYLYRNDKVLCHKSIRLPSPTG